MAARGRKTAAKQKKPDKPVSKSVPSGAATAGPQTSGAGKQKLGDASGKSSRSRPPCHGTIQLNRPAWAASANSSPKHRRVLLPAPLVCGPAVAAPEGTDLLTGLSGFFCFAAVFRPRAAMPLLCAPRATDGNLCARKNQSGIGQSPGVNVNSDGF